MALSDPLSERSRQPRSPVAVGPGRPRSTERATLAMMRDVLGEDQIQYGKVQPPPLRDEILARDRLLDWLHRKIHHRLILILADAGYGKTTLLADFARRTRLRTMWYRLDDDDVDWTSILRHLVAAGREIDPDFAPTTLSMLGPAGLGSASREMVTDAYIRELDTLGPSGVVLILDDYHLVDEASDMRYVTQELVARAPERLSIVLASRRGPGFPLARLRANGEVEELVTDDLRFDADETARLFRETYGRPLEPDVLADVTQRTEGWATSLQLVQTALRDRSPAEIRRFVRGLSGADQALHDHLAEEVVGDLPGDLQAFLMTTSILQVVTLDLAGVVTGQEPSDVIRLTTAAERLTLLSRRTGGTRRAELRYHPLVREFLESRLAREWGYEAVRELHLRVAGFAGSADWRTAVHHYWEAGDETRAHAVIDGAAHDIVARGEYSLTEPYVSDTLSEEGHASFEVLRSRRAFKQGDVAGALERARRAASLEPTSSIALANLASLAFNVGDFEHAVEFSRRLTAATDDAGMRAIAGAFVALIDSSLDGNVRDLVGLLRSLADRQRAAGETHFEGVTYLNLANALRVLGDPSGSLDAATTSIELLDSSSAGSEAAAAHIARAWALAHLHGVEAAAEEIEIALRERNEVVRTDLLLEAADIHAWYGDETQAVDHVSELDDMGDGVEWARSQISATRATLALRAGDLSRANDLVDSIVLANPSISTGHKARVLSLRAHVAVASGSEQARVLVSNAAGHAMRQSAGYWVSYCAMLDAVLGGSDHLRRFIRQAQSDRLAALSMGAELSAQRLSALGSSERQVVSVESQKRPVRWTGALRHVVDGKGKDDLAAARLLEAVGTIDDVPRLRAVARSFKGRPEANLGKGLARRVASRVFVMDQGRVSLAVGDQSIEGSAVRRKVLGLLCFLLSRPQASAARDEVLDALWPDFDPSDALNSLNQTVYFLRRVFEPDFRDDHSPGYLHHEGDVVWLDSELVHSQSQRCWDLIRSIADDQPPDSVHEISEAYCGPFALDFAYEEWATSYRSSLQSAYLQIVERAIRSDTESGHFERGILLARRALEVAPEADSVELSLLRLYKLSGSHAAAAEQYGHYATWMRDTLGFDPPTLDSL